MSRHWLAIKRGQKIKLSYEKVSDAFIAVNELEGLTANTDENSTRTKGCTQ